MSELEDIIRDGEVQYPDGPSSEWGSVHGEEDNASPLSNDETNSPEGDQSNDFTFDLKLDDDDILDEESESPVFDLEPFAEEFQITDEFENILPVPTYTPLDLETQSSQFKRRLIPLEDVKSDIAKNTRGTQYKNAQIYINEQKSLPQDWRHAPTGIGLRFRIEGGCASRRIIIQLPVHHNSKLVFSASFEIHPCHIKDFSIKDLSTNEAVEQKVKKKRKDALPERESYIILAIGLHTGGIGFGLEYNAKFLSKADKQLLWYMRRLSINYAENDSTPQRIILRINARWIDYEDADSNSNMRRKTEARDRLYNQLDELMLDATTEKQTLTPYRSQQGDPVTQWGQFVTREIIKKESQGLVAFRTRYSFSTLSEYQITFAYASHLEWENEREIADFVSTQCHGVAFIIVNKSDVLALLKLSMPKSEKEENAFNIESWAPREGTTAAISFRPPDKLNVGNVKCYGVCTANIYDLPYPPGSLFHIVTRNVSYYAKFAVEVGKNINFFPARLLLDVPVSGAKRQVDAINRLCRPEPELTCFSRLLLNQQCHLKSKRFNDPLASLDLSDEVVKDVVKRVISVRGIVWSESQRSCLQTYVRNFADNLLIIQGYPGTGKTLTLIGLTSIYLALGLHVMITAPTHYAADAICQGIQKWETLSGINLHPLRVYRPISESRAFRNHGKSGIDPEVESQHGDELSGDEDGDDYGGDSGEYDDAKNIPSSNAVVAQDDKAQAIHPTPSDENTEAAAIEPSNNNAAVAQGDNVETAPDALGPLQDQIMIGECLKMTHEAYHRRYYSRTDISLEAKVFEMASDDSQTLMAIRPSSEQAVTIKGDWFAQIENGNLIPEGDEVDVLALLRDYAEKIKESEYRKLEDSDKKTALWAFKTACKAVIRQTRLLISTNNNTGDGIIASNFGHDATGIIIIRDEDFKELEANSWIPVSKLAAAEKIKGVVSCGDAHQLVPTVMSRYGQPCNEFSAQLALSLPARLLHMNHPSVKLTEQFRYRDVFVPWLNHRTYNGELRSHSSVKQIKVNSNFLNAIKEILDFKHPATEVDLGYLVVSVEGSSCEVEEPSKSRFNDPHRRFCVELLKANFAHGGYAGKDITIVTPYMAQVVRIRQSIFKMVQHGLLPIDQMPNVATADSMQGKESKVIIYDWVISAADRGSDLGFTSDDNRSNVALSRMTEVMIVLVPGDVGTGGLSEPKAQKYNELGDNVYRRVPYPCAFVKWAQSNKIFMTYKKPTDIPVPIDETPATETGTGEWSSTPASTEAPAIEGATIDESPATETGTGEWSSTPAIDGAAIENVIGE